MRIIQKAFFVIFLSLFFPKTCQAICPVCTVAVGAGLGLCRFLGIDDTISGIWIGGLICSSSFWLADFLRKRKIQMKFLEFWVLVLFYLLALGSLFWGRIIGISGNTLWGLDKVFLGSLVGLFGFLVGVRVDRWLRKRNGGVVYFYYQKVILPVFFLAVLSLIFYYLTC